jgi:dihydroorotate dehydrogenase (fumarate)
MDLATSYLGLRLAHPFIAGASPLGRLDYVRQLEDGGCAAIVLTSLFEEQITVAASGRIRHMDPLDTGFAAALSAFPQTFAFGPDEYLDQIRRTKHAVDVPVIASLNGTSAEAWLIFASRIEQAGADALELNLYEVTTNLGVASPAIERDLVHAIAELKEDLRIPVSIKLSPYFTAVGNLARRLDNAGADGLILFNRYYEPDIDTADIVLRPKLDLSTNAELPLRLRWLGLLHGRVRASLAASGGIATPDNGVKALLAGADAVQLVSAILRHGPAYFGVMKTGLEEWMNRQQFDAVESFRGRLSAAHGPDATALERANYLRSLQNWPGIVRKSA